MADKETPAQKAQDSRNRVEQGFSQVQLIMQEYCTHAFWTPACGPCCPQCQAVVNHSIN